MKKKNFFRFLRTNHKKKLNVCNIKKNNISGVATIVIYYSSEWYLIMGAMLFSTDMLLQDFIQPAQKAYGYNQYDKACVHLLQLNDFLIGFGQGIKDIPEFDNLVVDVHDRIDPQMYYKQYYEKYSRKLMQVLGLYQKELLKHIHLTNQFGLTTNN